MKYTRLLLLAGLLSAASVQAQTNVFPAVGNAGVKAPTPPQDMFHIHQTGTGVNPGINPALRVSLLFPSTFGQVVMESNPLNSGGGVNASVFSQRYDYLFRTNFNQPTQDAPGSILIASEAAEAAVGISTTPSDAVFAGSPLDRLRLSVMTDGAVMIERTPAFNTHFSSMYRPAEILSLHSHLGDEKLGALRISQSEAPPGIPDDVSNAIRFGVAPFDGAWSGLAKAWDAVLNVNSGDLIISNVAYPGGSGSNYAGHHPGITGGAIRFTTTSGDPTYLEKERMTITADGKVGIGNIIPNELLEVAGTIKTKELVVTLQGWPDYVFDPKEAVPSIRTIYNLAKKDRHLPGVPSAAEVEIKGVKIGENQAQLLKYIEILVLNVSTLEEKVATLSHYIETRQRK